MGALDATSTAGDRHALIRMLADGRFHSGTVLAGVLGVSRGAIWKRVQTLASYGVDIERVRGRGYRLATPLDLLDAAALQTELARIGAAPLHALDVLPIVDSTSRWLLERAGDFPAGAAGACLAECQTAGRGRRGRVWVSPFGANLYLSVAWHLQDLPPNVGALSLVAGLATADALENCGYAGVGVKWPNDLVHEGRKLGGVLVDLHGQPGGACRLVIGVGINVAMPASAGATIDQPWVDLQAICPVESGLRNRLGGGLIGGLLAAVEQFMAHGLDPFLRSWSRRDAVAGREVELRMPDKSLVGTALGVDDQGALRLRTGGEIRRCFSDEVSLRTRSS